MSTTENTSKSFIDPFDTQGEAKPNATTTETLKSESKQDPYFIPQHKRNTLESQAGYGPTIASAFGAAAKFLKPGVNVLLEACDDRPRLLMIIGVPAVLGFGLILFFLALLGITAGTWGLAILFRPIGKAIVLRLLHIVGSLLEKTLYSIELASIAVAIYISVFTLIKSLNHTQFSQVYISPALKIDWKGVLKHGREAKQD